jgi:hypothetical protein
MSAFGVERTFVGRALMPLATKADMAQVVDPRMELFFTSRVRAQ